LLKRFDMTENAKNKRAGVKSFIGGTILTDERVTKQMPFIIFLAVLGLLMITNRNWSERTIRKVEILQDTLDNLRSESITLSAYLMNASRPSEIAKKVEAAGLKLKEPMRPPRKITVNKGKLWISGK
jgi:Bacteriodetes cell division protein (FtsL-like)